MSAIAVAYVLDLLIGDPVYTWHPVRILGRIIAWADTRLNRGGRMRKLAGALLALSLPCATYAAAWLVIDALRGIHGAWAWLAECAGIYWALSIHDLRKEAGDVYRALAAGDRGTARSRLSRIVGRDTSGLGDEEIVRAGVETVAESTVDGIIAPLFYAALGGAPFALAYKAVNTLDSMIGHRSERYRDFGFAAARQDDVWNWVPARISFVIFSAAAAMNGLNFRQAVRCGWRDGILRGRQNGAVPEATVAGALGIRLGGKNIYDGREVLKPYLGEAVTKAAAGHLRTSVQLMLTASCLSAVSFILARIPAL